jgi:transcriptional regulator with GAF, ATPase, and Fis domain
MACAIYMVDAVPARRARVIAELGSLLDQATILDSHTLHTKFLTGPTLPASIALLGLSASGEDSELPIARAFTARGSRLLVYASEWRDAPLSRRCRVLLAGVADVHDADDSQFATGLRAAVTRAVDDCHERSNEARRLSASLAEHGMAGQSAPMLALCRWIHKVAPLSDLPVLITGDTGTGKELVARAIHRLDPKRGRAPFVPLNCAALTSTLAESELFGHRRGSFSGAATERRGLIRAAQGGTLFLDEIGELELGLQAKLLRVLQENRVRPVGDDREEPVSVRVLAATNRDLEAMVERGQFRMDLLHRLNALTTRVPSLADRGDDIEALVAHFHQRYGTRPAAPVDATLVSAVRALHFPGNVRQLENVIRYAIAQAGQEGTPTLAHLPPSAWDELSRGDAAAKDEQPRQRPEAPLETQTWNLSRSIAIHERQLIEAALARARGNRTATARLLGITPRSVFNKIRKHRLAG